MSRIVLSAAARADRRAITAYTVDRFGVHQARRLRDRFAQVFNTLAHNPAIGRLRPELDPPGHRFRYFVVLRFIVVYEPSGAGGIRVARILNGMRHLAAELDHDAGDDAT